MTRDQRRGIENAIWLCAVCATKIDRDVDRYPAEHLRQWKEQAEALAILELGRPLPAADDATHQLVAAMTGQTAKFLPKAINNVHQAAVQVLEALDPRLRVETSYLSGVSTIGLRPREPIEFSMTVPPEHAKAWQLALSNLELHASPARLPMQGVSVAGSPILEAAFDASKANPGGSLSIVPRSMPATVRLILHDPVREQAFPFDDVLGTVYVGQSSARFVGCCCDDTVGVTLGIPVAEMDKGVTITVELNLCSWEGMDASRLRHFEKLDRLCSALGTAGRPR